MALSLNTTKTIAINDLRRRFGEIEKELPYVKSFIITKKGKPFATLSANPSIKREMLKKSAGAFVGTPLDNNKLWNDILKRRPSKKTISW